VKVSTPAPSMANNTTSSPHMNSGANSTRMMFMRLHLDDAGCGWVNDIAMTGTTAGPMTSP
jgi:hypothetical protein